MPKSFTERVIFEYLVVEHQNSTRQPSEKHISARVASLSAYHVTRQPERLFRIVLMFSVTSNGEKPSKICRSGAKNGPAADYSPKVQK